MLPVIIDISGLVAQFSFSQDEVKSLSRLVLKKISDRYMQLWEEKAKKELHQTRSVYMSGMRQRFLSDSVVEFEMEGKGASKLGLMIETGANAFDIKEGFRKSKKAKNPGTPEWYLTIPFRIATADAIAESTIFSGKMTEQIQNLVKEKGTLSASDLPAEYQTKGIRPEISQTKVTLPKEKLSEYEHKNPIFEGLQKGTKQYHGQYNTFRRVSENSALNSWIHKGFSKKDFMGKTLSEMEKEFPELINSARKEFLDAKFGQ